MPALRSFSGLALLASLVECLLTHKGNASSGGVVVDGGLRPHGHYGEVPQDELVVVHVGKTGGTTLKKILEHAVKADAVQWPKHSECIDMMAECSKQPHRKYVFLVRAPVHRYVSGWISRYAAQGTYLGWTPGEKKAFERFATPDQLACALSSEDANEKQDAEAAIQEIKHTGRDINTYVGGLENLKQCKKQVLWVGRTEHFEEDYGVLLRTLKRHGYLARRAPKKVMRERARNDEYSNLTKLSRCAVDNLQNWFQKDYAIINYLAKKGFVDAAYPAEVHASDAVPPDGQAVAQYWQGHIKITSEA